MRLRTAGPLELAEKVLLKDDKLGEPSKITA
jgi:hypothetical protein